MSRVEGPLLTKCKSSQETVLHEVRFQNNQNNFGNMVFGDIGKLNVITGPNGVGKSLLLTAIRNELETEKWGKQNIYPVYLIVNATYVKIKWLDNESDYKKKLSVKEEKHKEYEDTLLNGDLINREQPEYEKYQKTRDRQKKVYKEETKEKSLALQMRYEFGMSHDDMEDEYSIVKYLWIHKLIKFGEADTDTDDKYKAIDINSHLKDFKYEISPTKFQPSYRAHSILNMKVPFQFKNRFKKKVDDQKDVPLDQLSSGERTYFMLLLWDIIAKINKSLIEKEGHKGLVANGGKYVFLLGECLLTLIRFPFFYCYKRVYFTD